MKIRAQIAMVLNLDKCIGCHTCAFTCKTPDVKFGASIGSNGAMLDALTPFTNRYSIGPMISWNLRQSTTRARIPDLRTSRPRM